MQHSRLLRHPWIYPCASRVTKRLTEGTALSCLINGPHENPSSPSARTRPPRVPTCTFHTLSLEDAQLASCIPSTIISLQPDSFKKNKTRVIDHRRTLSRAWAVSSQLELMSSAIRRWLLFLNRTLSLCLQRARTSHVVTLLVKYLVVPEDRWEALPAAHNCSALPAIWT